MIVHIKKDYKFTGWRKLQLWYKNIKRAYLHSSNIHRKKGKNYKDRLINGVSIYLSKCEELKGKVEKSIEELKVLGLKDSMLAALLELLVYYHNYLVKHIDLVDRRIIQGEKIPHNEKVFSIFEPHVEWIQKGKENRKVELGHNVLITSDQYHFIVDHQVVIGSADTCLPIPLSKRLQEQFKENYKLQSISFDRGFYSLLAKKALSKIFKEVVMPKRGKKTVKQEEEEGAESFVARRRKHSAVEANINELEHTGANKVLDKGLDGFKNYVAWSVLSYNLKRLGKLLLEEELLETATTPSNSRKKAA